MAAALERVPEARLDATAPAARSTAPAPGTASAQDSEPTVPDQTILDGSRHPELAFSPERTAPMKPAVWKRWWRPFAGKWTRQRWWIGATAAGAVLVILIVWAAGGRRRDGPATVDRPPPERAAVPSAPMAMDELAPMTADATPGLVDAAQLVRMGLRDQAITVLQEIRHDYPRSAHANFLLAVVYFEKLWWSVGLQHAQAAIDVDPAYRRSPKLAKLLIRSLQSDSFWERAGAFLERDMAEISGPYLQEAAQSDRSARVRARAAQILGRRPMRPPASSAGP